MTSGPGATARVVVLMGVILVVVILIGACRPKAKGGVAARGCIAMRACCDDIDRHFVSLGLGADPHRTKECISWTLPSTNDLNTGECGYGTTCWCDRMLDEARTSYGLCR